MARVSKKNINSENVELKEVELKSSYYQTAIYTRLSKEDSGNDDSDTIENQVDIISKYIENSEDMVLKETYIDNGFTGVNFDRPDFKKLIQDAKLGKVNCIVVKDLSRLGRDYISVGEYLYTTFPSLGVRVISINDNYDSNINKGFDDIVISLKNLVNASYSKDISKKVTSALRQKQINGDFIGGYLYGYKKLNGEKNKLYIDENVKDVVIEVFNLRSEGNSFNKIANILNDKKIAPPKKYFTDIGILNKYDDYDGLKWNGCTVSKMTKSCAYIGNMAQGKKKSSIYSKNEIVSKEDWIIVEHTHEPIITMEVWNKVQEVNGKLSNKDRVTHKNNIFRGFLYCGNCGYPYKRKLRKLKTQANYFVFNCGGRKSADRISETNCKRGPIYESDLEKTLIIVINQQLNFIQTKSYKFEDSDKKLNFETDRNNIMIQIDRVKIQKLKLYEKYEKDIIELDDYKFMNDKLNADLIDFQKKYSEFSSYILEEEQKNKKLKVALKKLKKLKKIKSLNREILESLIEKIIVNDDKSIEIVWLFQDIFGGDYNE